MANTNQVIVNGKTILDLRSDTVTPKTLQKGITAHDKSGAKITGTLTVPGEETRYVELDMRYGAQYIVASTGMLMKQVEVTKPSTFLPENIKKGVNIGGVVGTLEAGGAGGDYNIQSVTNDDGTQTLAITDAEADLITFDIEVDFSNCPDADVTVWESLDTSHDLTADNPAAELKVQSGAIIAVSSSNLIAGATTEENASFDIVGAEGEYEHLYDHSSSLRLSTWTYLVAVGADGNDNFAYLVLSMREG